MSETAALPDNTEGLRNQPDSQLTKMIQNLELCVTHCRICGHRTHHRVRLSIHEWVGTRGEKMRPREPERKTLASEKQDRCTDLFTPHKSYSLGEEGSKKVISDLELLKHL